MACDVIFLEGNLLGQRSRHGDAEGSSDNEYLELSTEAIGSQQVSVYQTLSQLSVCHFLRVECMKQC